MLNPHALTRAPNGDYEFGVIPEILLVGASRPIFSAGLIRLQFGTPTIGFRHIEMKHGHNISHYYPSLSIEDFVFDICQRYNRIILQEQKNLVLMRYGSVTRCAVVAEFIDESASFYRVVTAYPMQREPNWAKRGALVVWER